MITSIIILRIYELVNRFSRIYVILAIYTHFLSLTIKNKQKNNPTQMSEERKVEIMKLNHDCVRELLLYLEENLDYDKSIGMFDLHLKDFSDEDVFYTVQKLSEAKYLKADIGFNVCGGYIGSVDCITWEGHKFLDTIRDNQVWSKTKQVLSKVSSASISFASTVASQVLTNLIQQQM